MTNVPSGRIAFLNEIADDPVAHVGQSLRVFGKLAAIDVAAQTFLLKRGDAFLAVSYALLADQALVQGTTMECIGEVEEEQTKPNGILLRARVARNIDTVSIEAYSQAARLKQQHCLELDL